MRHHTELRIEPTADVLGATRAWLATVHDALGPEWLASYITGSALSQGFDPRHSSVNLLIVARHLDTDRLDALARTVVLPKKPPHFDPVFVTRRQLEHSLDVFPIEWLEIKERHLLLEGDDVLDTMEVPLTYLRLQCEHELRGKHLRLRHAYIANARHPDRLRGPLVEMASSFSTLFRTLLRLRGETPPADTPRVIERVAELYKLDAEALLSAHLVRYSDRRYSGTEMHSLFRKFLVEVERLITAIDELRVP